MAKIQDLISLEHDLGRKKKDLAEKYHKKMRTLEELSEEEMGKLNEKTNNRATIIEEEVKKLSKETEKQKEAATTIDPKRKEKAGQLIEKSFHHLLTSHR